MEKSLTQRHEGTKDTKEERKVKRRERFFLLSSFFFSLCAFVPLCE